MSADMKTAELGHGVGVDAVQSFLEFPWAEALSRMKRLEVEHADSVVSPDMTFTALPAHLIVQADDTQRFNVEVCLPRLTKLFGLFPRVKFYAFNGVPKEKVSHMLQQFCADDLEQRHHYFTNLAQTNAI